MVLGKLAHSALMSPGDRGSIWLMSGLCSITREGEHKFQDRWVTESEGAKVKSLSRVRLFATPWTVAYHAHPSMGLSRHEYWSELPFPSPGDLPDPGIEPGSPAL